MPLIGFQYDDGGRAAAGFRGTTSDCVCRSLAIVSGEPYAELYHLLAHEGRKAPLRGSRSHPRTGVYIETLRPLLLERGWSWTPTMRIGSGCRVRMRADELPGGPLLLRLSRHVTAVLDGVEHSTYKSDRNGTRCVYGYWRPPR